MPKRLPAFCFVMPLRTTNAWPRREHGELERLADNLWIVDGPVPGLLAYRRQMVVVRDAHGRLLLHSAIALSQAGMAQLEALGTPSWLVVPNGHHRLDAPAYKRRYPQICVVAPRGSVPRVRRVVHVDLTYDEFPASTCLQLRAAPWPDAAEGVVQVLSADGVSLAFNDLLWTPPLHGTAGFVQKILHQRPQVPWLARQLYARGANRLALKRWLVELACAPELQRLIPGHGPPIVSDAYAVLQRVAATLA
jgi:hypothetical protein